MTYSLIEPCCGSAALSLHLIGARRQLVPYQGSKWSLRKQLSALLVRLGHWGSPSEIWLSDVGPFAECMAAVLGHPRAVAKELAPLVEEGEQAPRALYDRLNGGTVPTDWFRSTAELLWLQRMSFSGKAVGIRDGRWRSPGYNGTSAEGVEASESFGAVMPLGGALLRAVEGIPNASIEVFGIRSTLTHRLWTSGTTPGTGKPAVLLDPPYVGTVGYPCGDMPRDEVVSLALDWHGAGADVIVCEAEPVAELVALGWVAECIQEGKGNARARMQARARQSGSRGAEWVTYRRSEVSP